MLSALLPRAGAAAASALRPRRASPLAFFCSTPAAAAGAAAAAAFGAGAAAAAHSAAAAAAEPPPLALATSAPGAAPSRLQAMLAHNAGFVGRKEYEKYNDVSASPPPPLDPPIRAASSAANPVGAFVSGSGTIAAVFPPLARLAAAPAAAAGGGVAPAAARSRCVVVSCMDARLTTLLPHALGLRPGDGKIIKNAGAIISAPFGGIMRSVVVAIYALGADEVFVVGHHDCGMAVVQPSRMVEKMVRDGGISRETLHTLDAAGIDVKRWLAGFASVGQSVRESVSVIRNHPLVPRRVPVSGLIIDPHTGRLELVVDGPRAVAEAEAGGAVGGAGGGGGGGGGGGAAFWRDAIEGEALAPR